MVRFEILSKTILALVLFVCHSAHSLETGIKYPSNVNIEKGILYQDLKCTYLFSALTHLLVTKHLAGPTPYFLRLTLVISKIILYNNIAKSQIHSLYRLKVVRIDSLWILHLYLSMVHDFYGKSSNKIEDGRKVIATHSFVIDQLRQDLTECRKDNSFNNEWKIVENGITTEDELMSLMDENFANIKRLLTVNKYDYLGSGLQIGNLLMNGIGSTDDFIKDLMDVYNVQVEWYTTGERLQNSWHDAHILNWPFNFENLKLYYKLSFNFIKIIIFRLTVKHLYYLEHFADNVLLFVHYAREWYNKVKEFGDMLSLSEDLHVKNLLISLDNLVKQEEKIDSVATYLFVILNELCLPLGCVATKPFKLNEQEFEIPYKSSIGKDDLKINKSLIPIEYRSLENTRVFLLFLRWLFKFIDFNLVRLLMEYINEVKPW